MDYIEYIYTDSFGEFDLEEMAAISYFFENDDKNQFFDTCTYEIATCFLMEHKQFEEAKNVLEEAKKNCPPYDEFDLLEILIEKHNDPQKALKPIEIYYDRTKDEDALLLKSTVLYVIGNFTEATKVFHQFLSKLNSDEEKIESLLEIAVFIAEKDYEKDENFLSARVQVKQFIEKSFSYQYPKDEWIYYAEQLYFRDYLQEAKMILNHLIDLDSYNLSAWQLLSHILFDDEQYAEAAEAFRYRIALKDEDRTLYYYCGLCYHKLDKFDIALQQYDLQEEAETQELEDKDFYCDLLNNKGDCYMGMSMIDKALEEFRKVLSIDARNFKALVFIAQCYYVTNDNDSAIDFLEKALNLEHDYSNNQYENLYSTIAQVFIDIAEKQEPKRKKEYLVNAVLAYNKSLMYLNLTSKAEEINYDLHNGLNAITLTQIGKLYYVLEDYVNALVNFQLAYNFDETTPQISGLLAIAYGKMDLMQEAYTQIKMMGEEDLKFFKKNFKEFRNLLKYAT
jgi:tetratricopeptide (TPR) repeat protein